MFRSFPLAGFLRTLVAGVALAAPAVPVMAQMPPQTQTQPHAPPPLHSVQYGFGYIANLPDEEVGGAAYVILPRWGGVGLYVDAKFGVSGPSHYNGYDSSVNAAYIDNEVGGEFIKSEGSWWSANAAFLKTLSPYFTVYAGGGVAHLTEYALYDLIDTDTGIGFGGVAWVQDPRRDQYRTNFLVGMITRLTSRVSAHFGYETQPDGVTAGLTLRIPRW